eukprot:3126491-Amphidinium_carterae.1
MTHCHAQNHRKLEKDVKLPRSVQNISRRVVLVPATLKVDNCSSGERYGKKARALTCCSSRVSLATRFVVVEGQAQQDAMMWARKNNEEADNILTCS